MPSNSSGVALPNNLWLRWLLGNLAAFIVSYALMGTIDVLVDALGAHGVTAIGIGGHFLALALGAAIVAAVQAFLVRDYFARKAQWAMTVWLAYVTAFLAGETIGGLPLGLLVSFTLFGAFGGVLQIRLMRRHGFPAIRWALGSCVGWAVGGAVASGLLLAAAVADRAIIGNLPLPLALGIIGGIGGGVGAALTGPLLEWVLHYRSANE